MIELPVDFRDLLVALAEEEAAFVLIGGHAVAFHGHPRATKDMDILVRPDGDNAERVYRALAAFGAPLQAFEVGVADFSTYDGVLQVGLPPFRIDILNHIPGVTFEEAVAEGDGFELDGCRIPVIGVRALVKNKQTVGRLQDLADVEQLQRLGVPKGDKR